MAGVQEVCGKIGGRQDFENRVVEGWRGCAGRLLQGIVHIPYIPHLCRPQPTEQYQILRKRLHSHYQITFTSTTDTFSASTMASKDEEDHDLSPLTRNSHDTLPTRRPSLTQNKPPPPPSRILLPFWITLNTLATIGIVFINHSLFTLPLILHSQMLYAAYHFFLTYSLLSLLSSPTLFSLFTSSERFFHRKTTVKWTTRVPLAIAMGTQVVLPNMSNGYSSVMFYQVARILLTPTVAGMNFWWYGKRIPRKAGYALGAQCAGVFVLAWFDSRPSSSSSSPNNTTITTTTAAVVGNNNKNNSSRKVDTTTPLGVFLSFAGVLASSLYTIWVAEYHKRWEMNSMQLLHNQSWLGALLLMYGAPFEISAYLKGRSMFIDGGLGIGAWWGILLVCPHARELSPVSVFFFFWAILCIILFLSLPIAGQSMQ